MFGAYVSPASTVTGDPTAHTPPVRVADTNRRLLSAARNAKDRPSAASDTTEKSDNAAPTTTGAAVHTS